jgi:hypothetical protein
MKESLAPNFPPRGVKFGRKRKLTPQQIEHGADATEDASSAPIFCIQT